MGPLISVLAPVLAALAVAVWIWSLYIVIKIPQGGFRNGSQLLWGVVLVVAPIVGTVLYLALGHPWPARVDAHTR